jgi:aryl-alcohol dehydrogenase-like predicted oxidoreductase
VGRRRRHAAPARGRGLRQPGNYEKNADAVERLRAFAAEKQLTVAQAWLLAQGDDIVPIPGAPQRSAREENAGAAAVELTSADLETIHQIIRDGAFGERYPEGMMPSW